MTLTGLEVERMPSESRATAVRVCHPSAAVVVAQVTEYGAVNLHGLSLRRRAEALISIAHPDFRAQLAKDVAALRHFTIAP